MKDARQKHSDGLVAVEPMTGELQQLVAACIRPFTDIRKIRLQAP